MNRRQSISQFITASIFLLALLFQSVHQIHHLSHHQAEKEQSHLHENCHHAGHIQDKNHCEFCDFTFFPSVDLIVQVVNVPESPDEINSLINVEVSQHFVSQYVNHKKLRGPPFTA